MLPEDYIVLGMYLINLISFFNIQLLKHCTNKRGETQDIQRKDGRTDFILTVKQTGTMPNPS